MFVNLLLLNVEYTNSSKNTKLIIYVKEQCLKISISLLYNALAIYLVKKIKPQSIVRLRQVNHLIFPLYELGII